MLKEYFDESPCPIQFEIVANHVTSSTVRLIKWWLDSEKSYSVEEMGDYLFRMVFKPTRKLLELKEDLE